MNINAETYTNILTNDDLFEKQVNKKSKSTVFMFPCMGNHYLNMGKMLYESENVFREHVDRLCKIAEPLLGLNLKDILYHEEKNNISQNNNIMLQMLKRVKSNQAEFQQKLNNIIYGHPAVFIIEYALSKLLIQKGIKPEVMLGQSIGEYTAACLSGVLSPQDTLFIITERARMIQKLPDGCMTIALLSENEIIPLLGDKLSLSVVATPFTCTVGGPSNAIIAFEKHLKQQNVACTRFGGSSQAIHTKMMNPIRDDFVKIMKNISLSPPSIPYISNVTGTWITDTQATDPQYWFEHTCSTVRLGDGIGEILNNPDRAIIEVGPGHVLSSFVKQHPKAKNLSESFIFQTMPMNNDVAKECIFFDNTLRAVKDMIATTNKKI